MESEKDLAPNLILKQLPATTSSNASLTQIWFQSDSHQLLRTLLAIAPLLTILRCSGHLSWQYGDQFSKLQILNKMGNLQGKAEGVWEGVWVSDNEGAGILGFQQVDRVLPGDVGLVPPLVILLHL